MKIQLKGRLSFGKKYVNKKIYVMFKGYLGWYLYPHDEALEKIDTASNLKNTRAWMTNGDYHIEKPKDEILNVMGEYLIKR